MYWIVAADSEASTLQTVGEILCKQQMRVTGFKSAQTLLDTLKDNRPDLILLGNIVWELGGFEAIDRLKRSMQPGNEIPVLLMADPNSREPDGSALPRGALGVVGKPIDAAVLVSRVRELLALQEQRSQGNTALVTSSLEEIASSLEECNDASNGLWMGRNAFGKVYRHILRYLDRYHGIAFHTNLQLKQDKIQDLAVML